MKKVSFIYRLVVVIVTIVAAIAQITTRNPLFAAVVFINLGIAFLAKKYFVNNENGNIFTLKFCLFCIAEILMVVLAIIAYLLYTANNILNS